MPHLKCPTDNQKPQYTQPTVAINYYRSADHAEREAREIRQAGGSAGVPGGAAPTPAGRTGMPMAFLACRELERTDVPHTMQNDALASSTRTFC